MREVEQDAFVRRDRKRDAAILEQVERHVVSGAPAVPLLAGQEVGKRFVAMDGVAVVGDQDGVERGCAGTAVVAPENAQQDAVLTTEDLLEPVQAEARLGETCGILRVDWRHS